MLFRSWDAAQTQSEVVDVLPTSSASVALNLYESGAADIVWDKFLVPNELLDVLLKRPDFHTYDYLGSFFCRYNVSRPPFNDVRVRRAFTQAIDKAQLARKITKGGETPARSHTPPATPNYTPPDGLEFDPAAARRWLAEAGFPGGAGFPAVVYLFNAAGGGGANQDGKIAVELQAMWQRELGVTVALKAMENKTFLAAQNHLEYDVCRSGWIADYDDANTFLDMFMSNNGNNRTGWASAPYDALIRQANQQTVPAKRAEILRQAETLLIHDELPIVPLYFYAGVNFFDPKKVEGIYQNLLDEHPIYLIRKK